MFTDGSPHPYFTLHIFVRKVNLQEVRESAISNNKEEKSLEGERTGKRAGKWVEHQKSAKKGAKSGCSAQ
jgi:hypothetical protein